MTKHIKKQEIFKKKSLEVLYLYDPIDEFVIPGLYNYEGKQFKSVTKGDLDLGDLGKEEKKEKKKVESKFKKLAERCKNILADQVKDTTGSVGSDERSDGQQDVPTPWGLAIDRANDIIGDIAVGLVAQDERLSDRSF